MPRSAPLQDYVNTPVGEQLAVHLERRAAIRRDVPLLPRRLSELLAPWRTPAASGEAMAARAQAGRADRLASQTK